MKNKNLKLVPSIITVLLVISLISCKKEENTEEPTKDGLISFFPFQGGLNDNFGTNDGMGVNSEYVYADNNNTNKFLKLNGVDSYVIIPNPFDYESRTLSLWFNVIEAGTDLGIIYSSDNPSLNFGMTIISTRLVDNKIELYFNVSNNIHKININANTWYNATISVEGKYFTFYLNGEMVHYGNFESYICSYNGTSATVIGCLRTLDQRFFNGYIDNVRVYNRKLSDHEIEIIYKSKFLN